MSGLLPPHATSRPGGAEGLTRGGSNHRRRSGNASLGLLPLALLLVVITAVYAPTLNDFFAGDDFLVLGPVINTGPWELIGKSFVMQDDIVYWRPLVSPLYALEVHGFGLRPWAFHAVALGLHLANATLLAHVALALTGRRGVSLAAGLLFGVHAAHTTTVAQISSTVELLSVVWYFGAVLCAVRYVMGAGRRWYWASVAAFILALLSKESTASAAGVLTALFVLTWWRRGRPPLRLTTSHGRSRGIEEEIEGARADARIGGEGPRQGAGPGFGPTARAGGAGRTSGEARHGAMTGPDANDDAGRALTTGPWRLVRDLAPFWLLVIPYIIFTYVTDTADPTGIVRRMYFPGVHALPNLWWFLARLAAPLTNGHGPTVSATGHAGAALLLAFGGVALLRGTWQARFLTLWTLIALTPLAPWRPDLLLGRFTYQAAAPFAVLVALAGAWAATRLGGGVRPGRVGVISVALTAAAVLTLGGLTVIQNRERGSESRDYQLLVTALRREAPDPPPGTRIALVDGIWSGPFHALYLDAVADTPSGKGARPHRQPRPRRRG
ncbi:MAG: hypothetical protein U0531_20790 [Dehalococcoidia bacterium]